MQAYDGTRPGGDVARRGDIWVDEVANPELSLLLTARDREMVGWIAGLGAASARDVATRFAVDEAATYRRLRMLAGDGLLTIHRVLHRQPGLYVATIEGMRWSGLGGAGVQRVGPANFTHHSAVARVAATLGRGGAQLLGERELRLRERRDGRLLGSVELGGGALHRPDLLATTGRSRVAVEIELTVKAPRRLERICTAYARARHLDRAVYLAAPSAARALRRAVAASASASTVRVLALHDTASVFESLRPRA